MTLFVLSANSFLFHNARARGKKVNTSPIIGDDLCLRFLDFFYGEKTVIVLMLPLPIWSLQKTNDIKQ